MKNNWHVPGWLATLLLGGLTLLIYWAGLPGGFFFDDGPSILQAPGLRMAELSWEALAQAWSSGGAGPTGRPIAQLSFALNHYLSGFDPWAYKLTNLGVHLLCAWMVYRVLSECFQNRKAHALLATALWLLHPLQLLPVLHVVQRMTSLSALFLLAALWLHLRARSVSGVSRPGLLLLGWGVLWPMSLLSKETGLLLPAFVLAWELIVRRSDAGRLDNFARLYAAACLLLAAGAVAYLLSPMSAWLWLAYEFRPFDATQRLLTEARVLWFYVGLAILPRANALGLYHDDFPVSSGWLEPWTTLPAVLAWMAVLWLIWYLRRRAPLAAFGLAWFLVGHLMESTVLPLELVHEHRNYLPLLGLLLACAAAVDELVRRNKLSPRAWTGLALLAVLACAVLTAVRAHQYGDELRRTLAEVQHHPRSARAQHNLGAVLAELPAASQAGSMVHGMARQHLERATALDPNFKLALLGVLDLGCRAGQGVDPVALAELTLRLGSTLFAPGDRNVLYALKESAVAGQSCLNRQQVTQLFQAALANRQVGPGVQFMFHSWLADYLWLKHRDLPAAKQALAQSLALNPGHVSNRLKWAQLLWLGGEREASRRLLLALRSEALLQEERQTLEQLLAEGNITTP